ncbi:MAG: hypothetical protein LBT00_14730 [Spirochaetaceae bacterium]|nr:hypothetical protein [Spirochaetaceae bacterium]
MRFVAESSLRDGGNRVAVGEAIQTGKAFTLDCFALLAMTEGLARNDGGRIVIANPKGEAIQTGAFSLWIASLRSQ